MSRHTVTVTDREGYVTQYAYGFDRPCSTYFLDVKHDPRDTDDEDREPCFEPVVGFDGAYPGTGIHLLHAMKFYEILDLIPEEHKSLAAMDLPIP